MSFPKQVNKNQPRKMFTTERRYRSALTKLRSVGRQSIPTDVQTDIAYLINKITSYGFSFFANHYIYREVVELENIANRLQAKGAV